MKKEYFYSSTLKEQIHYTCELVCKICPVNILLSHIYIYNIYMCACVCVCMCVSKICHGN